jgi:HD-GYP domain-containing protein (c-di-GMP phosphodiesterase class II)
MIRRLLVTAAAALLGAFVAVAASSAGLLDRLENDTVDLRFSLRETEAPQDIVIVGIDDESIDELGEWPLSRKRHAKVVDQLRKAKPRLIVYDVQFTEPSGDDAADMALYDAFGRAGGAVLATSTSNEYGETTVFGGEEALEAIDSRAGAANLPTEEGGIIRHYERRTGKLPALAVVAAERLGRRVDFAEDPAWIDFRGGSRTFETISFLDLHEERVNRGRLRGKIVIVGATSSVLQDLHPTPTSGAGLMPGPEIQANALWTALNGNPLRDAPGWIGTLALALLALIAPLPMLRHRFLLTVATTFGLAAAYASIVHALFLDGLVAPLVAPLLALVVAALSAVVAGGLAEAAQRRRVSRRNQALQVELKDAHLEIVTRLAIAAESHDDQTGGHIERISHLTHRLALAAGVSEREAEMIRYASLMHDVGKIATPDAVLRKPGKLDDVEWEIMRRHTLEGARILSGSSSRLVQLAETIAMTHHERWDGAGYPLGLAGEDIPLAGRITAVCDVFDALVSRRTYKSAWTVDDTVGELREQSGKQFDPRLVELFVALVPDLPPELVGGETGEELLLRSIAAGAPDFVASIQQAQDAKPDPAPPATRV